MRITGPGAAGKAALATPLRPPPERGLEPEGPLRRATKMHSTLVKRRTTSLARLDALGADPRAGLACRPAGAIWRPRHH